MSKDISVIHFYTARPIPVRYIRQKPPFQLSICQAAYYCVYIYIYICSIHMLFLADMCSHSHIMSNPSKNMAVALFILTSSQRKCFGRCRSFKMISSRNQFKCVWWHVILNMMCGINEIIRDKFNTR